MWGIDVRLTAKSGALKVLEVDCQVTCNTSKK